MGITKDHLYYPPPWVRAGLNFGSSSSQVTSLLPYLMSHRTRALNRREGGALSTGHHVSEEGGAPSRLELLRIIDTAIVKVKGTLACASARQALLCSTTASRVLSHRSLLPHALSLLPYHHLRPR